MFRVAIAEDEEAAVQQLQQFLHQFAEENDIEIQIDIFCSGAELTEHYRCRWDLLILDVDMPVMNGLETARSIREADGDVCIIFITNLAQYAIKGYEVDAIDYILKPVNYYALSMRLKRVLRTVRSREEHRIVVKKDGDLIRLPLSRIFYIEVYSHNLNYHTAEGDLETGGPSLSHLEKELKQYGFVRCHNGYLVNLRYVDSVQGNNLCVMGKKLPVSRNRRRDVLNALMQYANGGV